MIPDKAIKLIITKSGRDNTEIAVGTLIAYGVFPQTTEGIASAKKLIAESEKWLVPSELPEYYDGIDSDLIVGRDTPAIISIRQKLKGFYKLSAAGTEDFVDTTVYIPGDKFVDDGKEFAVKIETDLEDALEKTSDKIMDSIDEILRQDKERFEEFKRKQAEELKKKIEKINTPERVSQELTIKIPSAHYIQGQAGRWQPEFENDIDHAVYFAGKSPLPKGPKQREVLDWLKSLGLTYDQIHDHREAVLEKLRETIALPGVEEEYPYVYIDAVDQDFVIDTEEDDEELEEDLDGLDDLLDFVRSDEEISEKKISEDIEEEIVDAVDEDEDDEEDPMANADVDIQSILDGDEDEISDIAGKLTGVVNKPKKQSSYSSNKKIFDTITVNFGRIQATLDIVNRNLEQQNTLIKANIDTQLAVGDLISNQTDLLGDKFDLILEQFEKQLQHSKDLDELEKKKANEDSLEAQRDAAGVSDFQDLTQSGGKSKRQSKIGLYYKKKLLRKLYRKTPKKLRSLRTKARSIQKLPGKIGNKLKTSTANRVTKMLPQRAGNAVSNLRSARSAGRNLPGLRQALSAWEYSDRKASGQSDLQAVAGVGAGLGGAAAGAAAGAATGAAIGAALGLPFFGIGAAPGAAIGSAIGGILGLVGGFLGGNAAAGAADKLTGADQIDGQHETGGLTKPGTAMLHGTEAIINRDAVDMSPLNTLGGIMIASTTEYINSAGAVAAPIAPSLKGVATQMARQYDVPSTIAQTNIGGTLPKLDTQLKKVKEKRKQTPEQELSGMEKDLLETQDPESFADKLLKMLDPEGKFQELLKNINNRPPGGPGGEVSPEAFVLLGGSQDAQQQGIDFTLKGTQNRAVLGGVVTEIGHQYDANSTGGDGRKGAGYGNYIVIKSTNPLDGSQVDMLYAHFPKGEIKVSKGDTVSVGQDLGRMATEAEYGDPSTRKEVGSGTGPHTSLDFFKPGTQQAHSGARALGDYILKELGKGSNGAIEKERQQAYQQQQQTQQQPGAQPTGDFDVILPLDHVKPGNENKIPDKKGGNTFENARATGAAGRERDHQDKAASKIKEKLEAKGLRVKIITPEDFGNYEDYDKYIVSQSSKGTRIVPLHFDAAVGQGGTGFLTRVRKGDSADAALANPIQQQLSSFQRSNPSLGNLGPTDTVSNATINRASAAPAALVEMGSMVAWEKQHGSNFTGTAKFNELATKISEGVYKGGGFNRNISPPSSAQKPKFQSLQGKDSSEDTKYLIVNQAQQPTMNGSNSAAFVSMGDDRWRSGTELDTQMRNLYIQRLGQ